MRIHSPIMTNANATGSFSGSFSGVITAEVFNSPGLGLVSGSDQITLSDTTGYSNFSQSLATGIATNLSSIEALQAFSSSADNVFATDEQLNEVSSSLSFDISTNTAAIAALDSTYATDSELTDVSASLANDVSAQGGRLSYLEGKTLVSESIQIDHDSTSNYVGNQHIDHSSVTFTAGDGLTGGGDLTTNREFSIGAGTGITVNADSIEIGQDVATTANVTFATASISQNLTVGGDLTVLGSRTELQVTELNVEDLNITIASGAADSAAANGAGITIGGANKALTWDHGSQYFTFNSALNVTGDITTTGTVDGVDLSQLETDFNNLSGKTLVSQSAQIASDISGSFTSLSSSFESRITQNANDIASLGDTYATDAELNASSSALITAYTNADSTLSSSLATDIATNTSDIAGLGSIYTTFGDLNASSSALITAYTDADTTLSASLAAAIASNTAVTSNVATTYATIVDLNASSSALITAHTNADSTLSSSLATDIASNTAAIAALDGTYATDAELNASSSALITAYTAADNNLSSSLASALTSEYQSADSSLSSSLAADIATNTAAIANLDNTYATDTQLTSVSASAASDIATNKANIAINAGHISALHTFTGSLNATFATDAELNASSSALITAYGNADSSLSSSLAADIAVNTAKIGVATETVRTAGALMDDEVDADIKTLSLPASTTISAFGKTLVDDADAATARTTLGGTAIGKAIFTGSNAAAVRSTIGVDAAGTDNSTDVTLAGSLNYITITGQQITRNAIDVDTDLSVTPTAIGKAIFTGSNAAAVRSTIGLGSIATLNSIDISSNTNLTQGTGITLTGDTLSTNDGQIVHDNLSGFVANEHINHSTVSISGGNGLTGGGNITQSRTLAVGQGDGISVTADAVAVDGTVARTNATNTFSQDQTFNNILVNGTGSFAYINAVTGSAKIIGDNYIILNADSPTERYSGLKVIDSGSAGATGSLEYDSISNHWFYESTTEGYAAVLMSGPKAVRGAVTVPTSGSLVVAAGNHLYTSDVRNLNGKVDVGVNLYVTGSINATGDIVAYYSSDPELKDNMVLIQDALGKVNKIGGYEFDWNSKQSVYEGHDIGVNAAEVEQVFPELVVTREDGYRAVKYEKLTAVLFAAVKELTARVEELEKK